MIFYPRRLEDLKDPLDIPLLYASKTSQAPKLSRARISYAFEHDRDCSEGPPSSPLVITPEAKF